MIGLAHHEMKTHALTAFARLEERLDLRTRHRGDVVHGEITTRAVTMGAEVVHRVPTDIAWRSHAQTIGQRETSHAVDRSARSQACWYPGRKRTLFGTKGTVARMDPMSARYATRSRRPQR